MLWCLLKVVIFSHFWLECLLVFLFSEHSKASSHLRKASILQHFPIITSDDGTGKIKHWQHGIYRKNTPPSMGLNNDIKNTTKMKHNNYPTLRHCSRITVFQVKSEIFLFLFESNCCIFGWNIIYLNMIFRSITFFWLFLNLRKRINLSNIFLCNS